MRAEDVHLQVHSQPPQIAGDVEEIDWMANNMWAKGWIEKLGTKIQACGFRELVHDEAFTKSRLKLVRTMQTISRTHTLPDHAKINSQRSGFAECQAI